MSGITGKLLFSCPHCGQKLSFLDGTLVKLAGRLHAESFSCKTMFYIPAKLGAYGAIVGEGVQRARRATWEGAPLFLSRFTGGPNPMELAAGHDGKGHWTLETVYDLFPILRERRYSPGTALSGGQQQMVAIGRALMSNPDVLLCDEISLGLAPVVIRDIYKALPKIRESGASVIVVEQDITQALAVADRVYCMMEGRVTLEGRPDAISREDIHAAYFGAPA